MSNRAAPSSRPAQSGDEQLRAVLAVMLRLQLRRLPLIERQIISMLYGVGCRSVDPAEIAARLQLTPNEVWQRHRLALQELAARVLVEAAA